MDVLTLAIALDVPPLLLFIPLGDEEEVTLGSLQFHPHLLMEWAQGEIPPMPSPRRIAARGDAWDINAEPLEMFRDLRKLERSVAIAENRLDTTGAEADEADFDRRLLELNRHLKFMSRSGLSTPPLPEAWVTRLHELERMQQ